MLSGEIIQDTFDEKLCVCDEKKFRGIYCYEDASYWQNGIISNHIDTCMQKINK